MQPWGQCLRCGRVTYVRGPCPTCRVYGEYGPTDRIEVVPRGQTVKLRRELERTTRERDEYLRLYQSARHEEDALRARVLRMERVGERMGGWARVLKRARREMR